ncbi:nicastrin-like isoform X1 [Acropora muricata]|uniref:nicastrin-like isoform X1 n=1 Tax=Acropora muricata TaxID=159855 RepID=UPI0034E38AAD
MPVRRIYYLKGKPFTILKGKVGNGDKVAQKIYEDLTGIIPCVVLTNATSQIGCTSSINGHVGVLHYVQNSSDVDWIINKGKHAPYVPLFASDQFDEELMRKLVKHKKISGALVIAVPFGKYRKTPQSGFSPDYECPNNGFGAYSDNSKFQNCKKVKWNKGGNGMSFKYYNIPIFALNKEKEVDDLVKCYKKHNSQGEPQYPLCGVQLKDFMYAAKDTPTCMRKTYMPGPTRNDFCQPLGDQNVWGSLYPIKAPLNDSEVVVLATKMDSSSFFHDLSPGVDNDGTGIIVALAAARLLGAMKRNGSIPAPKNPIVFIFFQGESWDYIGSSRMVYDMEHNDFPSDDQTWKVGNKSKESFKMKTSNIKYFIELNQLGLLDDEGSLWAHSDPGTSTTTARQVKDIITTLSNTSSDFNLTVKKPASEDQPLPPASFQRFLRSNRKIPGVVLTDHSSVYTNKFYNSRFDDLFQVGGNFPKEKDTVYLLTDFTEKLAKITAAVAKALYQLANDGQASDFEINVDNETKAIIGHLAFCFFNHSNCPLYREVFTKKNRDALKTFEKPFPRYVSVNVTSNTFTTAIYSLLLYFTGFHWSPQSEKCASSEGVVKASMQGTDQGSRGICVTGSVFFSPALSPAFLLNKFDSTEYSTWAESTWGNDLSVRLFLIASPELEGVTLAAGLIIALLSFGLVFFINKRADKLFTPSVTNREDGDS